MGVRPIFDDVGPGGDIGGPAGVCNVQRSSAAGGGSLGAAICIARWDSVVGRWDHYEVIRGDGPVLAAITRPASFIASVEITHWHHVGMGARSGLPHRRGK